MKVDDEGEFVFLPVSLSHMKSLTTFLHFSPSAIFFFFSPVRRQKAPSRAIEMSETADGNVIDAVKTATDNAKENIKEFECPIRLELILEQLFYLVAIIVHILLSLLYELGELALFLVQKQYHALPGLYAIIAVNFVDLSRALTSG